MRLGKPPLHFVGNRFEGLHVTLNYTWSEFNPNPAQATWLGHENLGISPPPIVGIKLLALNTGS
jgi:hypothetical protein